MAKRGRKAKAGSRYPCGKLRPVYDKGSDRVRQARERFGDDYSSALGRAYASGLLGQGNEAKARYDAGKRFSRLYSRIIEHGRYRCPLGQERRSAGSVVALTDYPREQADQRWLFDVMDSLDVSGLRPWLDQLVSEVYVDQGPAWLDRLLRGGKDPADQMVLKAAVDALDIIAPEIRLPGIRAEVY